MELLKWMLIILFRASDDLLDHFLLVILSNDYILLVIMSNTWKLSIGMTV